MRHSFRQLPFSKVVRTERIGGERIRVVGGIVRRSIIERVGVGRIRIEGIQTKGRIIRTGRHTGIVKTKRMRFGRERNTDIGRVSIYCFARIKIIEEPHNAPHLRNPKYS